VRRKGPRGSERGKSGKRGSGKSRSCLKREGRVGFRSEPGLGWTVLTKVSWLEPLRSVPSWNWSSVRFPFTAKWPPIPTISASSFSANQSLESTLQTRPSQLYYRSLSSSTSAPLASFQSTSKIPHFASSLATPFRQLLPSIQPRQGHCILDNFLKGGVERAEGTWLEEVWFAREFEERTERRSSGEKGESQIWEAAYNLRDWLLGFAWDSQLLGSLVIRLLTEHLNLLRSDSLSLFHQSSASSIISALTLRLSNSNDLLLNPSERNLPLFPSKRFSTRVSNLRLSSFASLPTVFTLNTCMERAREPNNRR